MQRKTGMVKAVFDRKQHKINIELNILSWEDDGVFFQYSPALDLVGYGSNEKEAGESFKAVLNEFVNYTDNKKTIYIELERLGWTVNKKKHRVTPPTSEQIFEDNETYRDLRNKPGVRIQQTSVGLALA